MLAVASGKGGVGKSTTAVNLSVAMARSGAKVGLMDADIYGPNVPVMMGATESPEGNEEGKVVPPERHGVKLVSLGLLVEDGTPVIWRGPMLSKMITQFLQDVAWAPLDYLLVDLPPGTGDVQLTLTQMAPLDGAVIVTTPQPVALEDVQRGVHMFKTVDVPVFGVVENMSTYICRECNTRTDIFGHGGGRRTAEHFGVPFLGEIPLDVRLRETGDAGAPVTVTEPDSEISKVYLRVAEGLMEAMDTKE